VFIAFFGAACVGSAVVLALLAAGAARSAPLVAGNLRGPSTDLRQAMLDTSARQRVLEPGLLGVVRRLQRLTPVARLEALERRIQLAGASTRWTLERALAVKVSLGMAGLVMAGATAVMTTGLLRTLLVPVLPLLGFFAVDLAFHSQADRRRQTMSLELPDTIDQVTVSVGAGLGLDAALGRVARTGTGPLAEEITRLLQDTRAGMSRADALRALVARTDVPELRTVVLALIQAEGFGVPISQVLRVQSAELRLKRRQRAEERAMKLPVKVLFPLVTCILPTVFIVLLGPAGIRITRMFSQM
jgi:tight adherence protein C